jgi:antitoxin component YwqK of YwqJK toxin-antitoxin module
MKTPRNRTYSALEGEYRSWDANGKLRDSGFYKAGYKSGVWIEQNSQFRQLGVYKKGWKTGDWKFYDNSGKFLSIRRYKKNRYDPTGELIRINN